VRVIRRCKTDMTLVSQSHEKPRTPSSPVVKKGFLNESAAKDKYQALYPEGSAEGAGGAKGGRPAAHRMPSHTCIYIHAAETGAYLYMLRVVGKNRNPHCVVSLCRRNVRAVHVEMQSSRHLAGAPFMNQSQPLFPCHA
jgi:hypothetical protein